MVGKQEVRVKQDEMFYFDREKFLEQLLKSPDRDWAKAARAYKLADNGLTLEQISADPQVDVNKSRVSVLISDVRGKLSEMSGPAYETWKASRLTKEGWGSTMTGSIGSPTSWRPSPTKRS